MTTHRRGDRKPADDFPLWLMALLGGASTFVLIAYCVNAAGWVGN